MTTRRDIKRSEFFVCFREGEEIRKKREKKKGGNG